MARLYLTQRAAQDLSGLPEMIVAPVLNALGAVEASPDSFGWQLLGPLQGLRSTRIGFCWILFSIEGRRGSRVIVRSIEHPCAEEPL